jgi:hypothetical protein
MKNAPAILLGFLIVAGFSWLPEAGVRRTSIAKLRGSTPR